MRSSARSGQAMLIAILTIGGAILGATTLAGLLTLYQIRANTDSENSAKAIFAADTGLNWALYNRLNNAVTPKPIFQNNSAGAVSLLVECYDDTGAPVLDDNGPGSGCSNASATTVFSRGQSLNSLRAFTLNLDDASVTVP